MSNERIAELGARLRTEKDPMVALSLRMEIKQLREGVIEKPRNQEIECVGCSA